MKRSAAIDEVCAQLHTCGECGAKFRCVNRFKASNWVLNPGRKRLCSRACRAKMSQRTRVQAANILLKEKLTGVAREGQHAKIEHNLMAKSYCLKSPDNVSYVFRNLRHFVRNHADLFPPGYAVEVLDSPGKLQSTRGSKAANGLGALFTGKRDSYLGWVGVWKKDRLGKIVWEHAETVNHDTPGGHSLGHPSDSSTTTPEAPK